MTPDQVDRTGLWQFMAAAEGHRRAHMTDEERALNLTVDEVEDLSAFIDGENPTP